MKRESKLLCLAGADPKARGRTGNGRMKANILQCSGEEKADRRVKLDPRQEGWKGKLPDNLTDRWQGKHHFCQMASSSVFYSLNKDVALACFFPNTSRQTFGEHRTRVNPYDFIRMLSSDKIILNFLLSCFKTQPFCFRIIAALQQLSALQQASQLLKRVSDTMCCLITSQTVLFREI